MFIVHLLCSFFLRDFFFYLGISYQVFLSDTNNLQLYGFKYSYLIISITRVLFLCLMAYQLLWVI